jgi:hypothetical protein
MQRSIGDRRQIQIAYFFDWLTKMIFQELVYLITKWHIKHQTAEVALVFKAAAASSRLI